MGVTTFGFEEAKRMAQESGGIPDDEMLLRLSYIGEELCNHARTITPGHSTGGYDDQTGNLRSSIGYRILKDGQRKQDGGFKSVGGDEGESNANDALNEFSSQCNANGWTLLIVAGMNYAEYVQAKGYNVLHLTAIELQDKIEELKRQLWQQ